MGTRSLIKRSVTVKGHRTSVALEAPFWAGLDLLAARRGIPLAQIIVKVDLDREAGLASALRLLVLEAAMAGEISLKTEGD